MFIHSVNVCIISIIIGNNLKMSRNQLQELALGALFHDIGKVIPDEALDKLTLKHDNVNEHTWRGFYYLRKKPEINAVSSIVALEHHEYMNGKGTPRGLKKDEIHLYAKIVGLANYYDNLVNPHMGNIRIKPHEALEKIMGLTNHFFEHDIVWQFLQSIATYPNGSTVRLSTNEIGIVVGQHKGLPTRPIIRLLKEQNSNQIEAMEIDLAKEKTVFIEEVLE
ncbi:HD-GYP domain-containing protein [Tepidibacillus sp. LV47]|uniref:HD-GYP domain-containing protein n=1 Tax=Tepidibacillus sp. LV47 TaxID=3398228 RepID=UPI003AAFDEDB